FPPQHASFERRDLPLSEESIFIGIFRRRPGKIQMETFRTDNPENSGTGPVVSRTPTPFFGSEGTILNLFLVEEQGPKDMLKFPDKKSQTTLSVESSKPGRKLLLLVVQWRHWGLQSIHGALGALLLFQSVFYIYLSTTRALTISSKSSLTEPTKSITLSLFDAVVCPENASYSDQHAPGPSKFFRTHECNFAKVRETKNGSLLCKLLTRSRHDRGDDQQIAFVAETGGLSGVIPAESKCRYLEVAG
ncbi:LOW QUALITY PROTEIN: hypothetical protein CVT26_002656, partial [Gymnopilus dilepis]